MRFVKTEIEGLLVVESDPKHDERGYFERLFDASDFEASGLLFSPRQTALSHNAKILTLRGMHYQRGNSGQAKLVRCMRGKLFDVAIDLRPASATYCKWFGIQLSGADHRALFIPAGFAHGFLTLENKTDILYQLGNAEDPNEAAGVRWNDARFKIAWPANPAVINARDANYPDFIAS